MTTLECLFQCYCFVYFLSVSSSSPSSSVCLAKYFFFSVGSGIIVSLPGFQPAGQTSPCLSVYWKACTKRRVSSTERPTWNQKCVEMFSKRFCRWRAIVDLHFASLAGKALRYVDTNWLQKFAEWNVKCLALWLQYCRRLYWLSKTAKFLGCKSTEPIHSL